MSWFNYYGLIAIFLIMVPNVIYAISMKGTASKGYPHRLIAVLEQIGRYGCMIFMIFNFPYTYWNFWFNHALAVYLITGGGLIVLYELGWIILRKKSLFRGLYLSIVPSVLFLFCGVMILSLPLIVSAIFFGIGHIAISYKNSL